MDVGVGGRVAVGEGVAVGGAGVTVGNKGIGVANSVGVSVGSSVAGAGKIASNVAVGVIKVTTLAWIWAAEAGASSARSTASVSATMRYGATKVTVR